jgi:hypothetical protein
MGSFHTSHGLLSNAVHPGVCSTSLLRAPHFERMLGPALGGAVRAAVNTRNALLAFGPEEVVCGVQMCFRVSFPAQTHHANLHKPATRSNLPAARARLTEHLMRMRSPTYEQGALTQLYAAMSPEIEAGGQGQGIHGAFLVPGPRPVGVEHAGGAAADGGAFGRAVWAFSERLVEGALAAVDSDSGAGAGTGAGA